MTKKHSLPDLNFGDLGEGKQSIESMIGVDAKKLIDKIEKFFGDNVDLLEVFNPKSYTFSNRMNDASFKTMVELYDTFDDREILYALWSFINANLKMYVIEELVEDVEEC